jgi:hypothetical protein
MQLKFIVLFSASFLVATSAFSQSAAPVEPNADYDVLVYKTKTGEPLYALVCDSGTTECNYKWASLCKDGAAQNSDPWGEVIPVPGYSRDKNNRPMRMFVCK